MNLTEIASQLEILRRTKRLPGVFQEANETIPGPGYEELMHWLSPAPTGTALLGLCEDGQPLLYDLAGSAPGGVLIMDTDASRSRALQALLIASVIHLGPYGSVEVVLISPNLDEYPYPPEGAYTFDWAHPGEPRALDLLYSFLAVSEDQDTTPDDGRLRLLIIDEAHLVIPPLDRYTQELLTWVAARGPEECCRVIAGSSARHSRELPDAFLSAFRSRIHGHHPASRSTRMPTAPQIEAAQNPSVGYYSIDLDGVSTSFWLPTH